MPRRRCLSGWIALTRASSFSANACFRLGSLFKEGKCRPLKGKCRGFDLARKVDNPARLTERRGNLLSHGYRERLS